MAQRQRTRPVPTWWRDAKLGIFVHWTPASVPGFAPVEPEIGQLLAGGGVHPLAAVPYTEWYENSLRFPGSPVHDHHRQVWGDTPYADFAGMWEQGLARWDPDEWARQFAATGARYVVLVAKHHDGYCLWPTAVTNPHRPGWHSGRDVVGELAEAVRAAGLRFGLYYSGGLDWTFDARPIGHLGDLLAALPAGSYPDYATAQVRELIDRYRPSVLWGDIAWPAGRRRLDALVAHYRERVPDGVLNDRFMPRTPLNDWAARSPRLRRLVDHVATRMMATGRGIVPPAPPVFDVRTPEYAVFDGIRRTPWECVRGMDRSFGYNRASEEHHFLGHEALLTMFADVVAKGGNLLLNVGPRGEDAAIPEGQRRRLGWLAEWHRAVEGAPFDTRPWIRPDGRTAEGVPLRFWARGDRLFVAVCSTDPPDTVTLSEVEATPATSIALAGGPPLDWRAHRGGLEVRLGPAGPHPVLVLEATGVRPPAARPGAA